MFPKMFPFACPFWTILREQLHTLTFLNTPLSYTGAIFLTPLPATLDRHAGVRIVGNREKNEKTHS